MCCCYMYAFIDTVDMHKKKLRIPSGNADRHHTACQLDLILNRACPKMCTVNILLLESSIISRLSGTTHADTPNSRRTDPAQKVFVLMKLLAIKTLTIRLCDYIMQ